MSLLSAPVVLFPVRVALRRGLAHPVGEALGGGALAARAARRRRCRRPPARPRRRREPHGRRVGLLFGRGVARLALEVAAVAGVAAAPPAHAAAGAEFGEALVALLCFGLQVQELELVRRLPLGLEAASKTAGG